MASATSLTTIATELNDLRKTVDKFKELHKNDVLTLRKEITQLHAQLLSVREPLEPIEHSKFCCGVVVPQEYPSSKDRLVDVSDALDSILAESVASKVDGVYTTTLRKEASTPTDPVDMVPCTPNDPIVAGGVGCPPRAPPPIQVQPCSGGLLDDSVSMESEDRRQSNANVEVVPLALADDETKANGHNQVKTEADEIHEFEARSTGKSSRNSKVSASATHHKGLKGVGRPPVTVHRGRGAAKVFTDHPVRLHHTYMREVCEEEYQFTESVWDVSLFVGDSVFSHCTSIFLFLMLAFMVGVLIVFNGIVIADFTNWDAFNQEQRDQLRDWRMRESHLLTYANAVTGTSMVSRVCGLDNSLMMSTDQKITVEELELYLPAEGGGLDEMILSGPVLTAMALFVWYMAIIRELHGILQLLRALNHVHRSPAGNNTYITHEDVCFHLRSISTSRATYGIVLTIGRIAMCVLLLISGTGYIIHTISMEDILLNCVALGIILEIDELMFESLAPARVRCFMQNLQPIDVPPWPRYRGADIAATIVFLALVAGLTIVNIVEMVPFIASLRDTLDILCGGNKDFLVQPDAVGLGYVIPATPFGEEVGIDQSLFALAVEQAVEMKYEDTITKGWLLWGGIGWTPSEDYTVEANLDSIRAKMHQAWFSDMRAMARWQTAEGKTEKSYSGRVETSLKFLRELLRNDTATCDGVHLVGMYSQSPVPSCYQLWNEHASAVTRIQAMCPVGCGCYSPWFGTIYKNRAGCPLGAAMSDEYQSHLDNFPCENPSGHNNALIHSWLNGWLQSTELQLHMSDAQKAALQNISSPFFCDSVYQVVGHEETMAPAICPVHFGCKFKNYTPYVNVEPYCPTSCRTAAP